MAITNNITKEESYKKLKEEYDGYHFSIDSDGLYNPFSVLNTLSSKQFSSYWFETGTPSFLVYQLKKTGYRLENITKESLLRSNLCELVSRDSLLGNLHL